MQFKVYAFTDGDKDGDRLTELGRRQVRAAARKYLLVRSFAFGAASPHKTTQETLSEMMAELGKDDIAKKMVVTELLSEDTAVKDDRAWAQLAAFDLPKNKDASVAEMFFQMSLYARIASTMTRAALFMLAERARELRLELDIVAVGHSPGIEMAAHPDTRRRPPASGVLYLVHLDERGRARIENSTELAPPTAEQVAAIRL